MRSGCVLVVFLIFGCGDNIQPDEVACTTAQDCDDLDACTKDTCTADGCQNLPVKVDDQIECTVDACDPESGAIVHTPFDVMCEQDGKSCTVATCSPTAGCSETVEPAMCDDGKSCSTDSCDPSATTADAATGCVHVLDNASCTDPYSCTTNTCAPRDSASDPTTGCKFLPNSAACGDSVDCTVDVCNPAGSGAGADGCTHTAMDVLCELDGKACTLASCSAVTGCSETPMDTLCSDGASCTTDACAPSAPGADPTTGCSITPNDSMCSDAFACTNDACSPGGTADPITGCRNVADDANCVDAFVCTADRCQPGAGGAGANGCVHAPNNAMCELDGKTCTVPSCSASTGCSETPTSSLCDDGATCSTDLCDASNPGPTGCSYVLDNAACADSAECSTDACSPGAAGANSSTGCLYTANQSACDINATCVAAGFDCVCSPGYQGTGLSCAGITCDALPDPANGTVARTSSIFPSTATYSCDLGFAVRGSATRTCGTDGHWSGVAPSCDVAFFVIRVGTGAAALTPNATEAFLEERGAGDGALLRTITLPTSPAAPNGAFAVSGSANTEGGLSRSADGVYVTLAGYATTPGMPVVSTSALAINRVVALVDGAGAVDTSTLLTNAFNGSGGTQANVRAACSVDGTGFWVSGNGLTGGAAAGVQYATRGATTSIQVLADPSNARHVHIFDGQLYLSADSSFVGVSKIGSGTPTTTGQVATLFAGVSGPHSFAVFDRDVVVAGPDTIYVAVNANAANGFINVQKFTFNGSVWTSAGLAPALAAGGVGTRGLAAWDEGGTIRIVATTTEQSANRIVTFLDTGVAAPPVTVLATAPANTVYRGVARSPDTLKLAAFEDPASINQQQVQQTQWVAQSFTATSTAVLTRARFFGLNAGGLADSLTVELRADSGGLPGALVTSGTVTSAAAAAQWIDVAFSTSPLLLAGATYYLVLTSAAADNDGYTWQTNSAGGYSGGRGFLSIDQGATWLPAPFDAMFGIYGQP